MKIALLAILLAIAGHGLIHAQSTNSAQPQGVPTPAMPNWVIVRVLLAAQPFLYSSTGMHLGQLIQSFRNGGVGIEYLYRSAYDLEKGVYRIVAGGGSVLVEIVDDL
jgi:hypothetical protein